MNKITIYLKMSVIKSFIHMNIIITLKPCYTNFIAIINK